MAAFIKVELTSGSVVEGKLLRTGFSNAGTSGFAVAVPAGRPLKGNELPWYFELENGRHITWGMGRHDIDEYPRLTAESLKTLREQLKL